MINNPIKLNKTYSLKYLKLNSYFKLLTFYEQHHLHHSGHRSGSHGYGESEHGERRMHHGGGHHNSHHQHHHMHHENDEHEIAADHGHEHMPNLFPIGLHHPGMHGMHGGGGGALFCFVY